MLARSRVNEVGNVTSEFISYLHDNAGLKYEDVTLVGFSLGSHIAGMAGNYLDGKIKKIVGIDPAG